MCECYQIGGRFIAEDPDCPVHGTSGIHAIEGQFDAWVDATYPEIGPMQRQMLRAAWNEALSRIG